MHWFRFYHEALDDPKVQRLPGDLFKVWVNLLCLASEQEERGTLPTIADIAFRLRHDEQRTEDALLGLKRAGLLDIDPTTDNYTIHAWQQRQPISDLDSTATARKRRQRERNKGQQPVTGGVTRDKRDGHGDVTGDVTRLEKTRGEEIRLEEKRGDQTRGEGRVASVASPSLENRPQTPAPRTRASGATHAPADFAVTEEMRAWAAEFAPDADVDQQTARFIAKARESRKTSHDWHASWEAWMTNPYAASKPETPPRGAGHPSGRDPTARPTKTQQSLAAIASFDPTRRHP